MNRALFAVRQFVSLRRSVTYSAACFQVMTNPEEIASLYRELSLFPSLSRADLGPVVTSQYGGKYSNIYTGRFTLCHTKIFRCVYVYWYEVTFCLLSSAEWSQRDLERNENVKFCRQYIVFHDDKSVVYSGASGNCTEIKGEYVKILLFYVEKHVLINETLSKRWLINMFILSDC